MKLYEILISAKSTEMELWKECNLVSIHFWVFSWDKKLGGKRVNRIRDLFKVELYTIRYENGDIEIAWLTEITIKYPNLTESWIGLTDW